MGQPQNSGLLTVLYNPERREGSVQLSMFSEDERPPKGGFFIEPITLSEKN
jgi:hypothetical protein